jgi:alpha-glucoside transport system substrate-binding protein
VTSRGRDPNRDPNREAAELVRRQIPAPPSRMDEVILGAVRRDCTARRVQRSARATARWRPSRLVLHSRWLLGAATVLGLAALVVFLLPGRSPGPGLAAASPFTPQCPERARGQLEVAGVWSGVEARNFRAVLARFERETGARVTYKWETHDIAPTLKKRLVLDCPPDVALLPQPGLLADLAKRGHLKAMGPEVRRLVRSNYAPEWFRRARVKGKLYGVWFKAANKSTFWYSRSAFRRAHVTPPHTWRELIQVAHKLRKADITPFSVAGAEGWTLTDWFENVYLATAGRASYDALARQQLPWTDHTVTASLERLAEILGRGYWLAGGTGDARKTGFGASVRRVFGPRQDAAMLLEGDFVASRIAEQPVAHEDDIGLFAFPRVPGHSRPRVVGGDVAVQFTSDPFGRRLMKFLAGPEAAVPWAREGGFISPNLALDPAEYPDETTRRLARAVVTGKALRFDLSDLQPPSFGATAGQGMWKILQDYLDGTTSVVETARQLESAAHGAQLCEASVKGLC